MLNIFWINTLIIDFSNFCIKMFSGLDVNKNVNSRIKFIFFGALHSYGRILTTNLSWSPTRVKFCQLITSLSVILS